MSSPSLPEIDAFLDRFFSEPNRLTIDRDLRIRPWVERIRQGDPLPSVLPCWREGRMVDWYGLAFDERQFRAIGEALTAFVGPTYTTFRGQRASPIPGDSVDSAVQSLTGGLCYRFRGDDSAGAAPAVWMALERMRTVLDRRGTRERTAPEPVGRVLRNYFMALQALDEQEADARLVQLRDEHHLDGLNLLFLKVQALASFGRWDELLALPTLRDLLRMRRPLAVTEALIRAAYQVHLSHVESLGGPERAVHVFREEVLPRYGPLYATRAGLKSAEAVKTFMLRAVASDPPLLRVRDDLRATEGLTEADRSFLEALAGLAPGTPDVDAGEPYELARRAASEADYDRAFSIMRPAPPSPARARLLCECAVELGTLEAKSAAVEAVQSLPGDARAVFLRGRLNQHLWDRLQPTPDEEGDAGDAVPVPSDWTSWLAYLDRHDGGRGAREFARQGAFEWSLSGLCARPGAIGQLSGALQRNRSQAAERVLCDCLPHLLEFFRRDPQWPNPAFREIYAWLTELLYVSTEGGLTDLIVFNDLLEALLGLGTGDAGSYRGLVEYVDRLWDAYASPATLDWVLDALELLTAFPRPAPEPLAELFRSIAGRCQGFLRKVGPEQRDLLTALGRDLGEDALIDRAFPLISEQPHASANLLAGLADTSVAIYTLNEVAARQVKQILESRAPGVRVSLCHETGGGSRLRQLARQSDLFIMAVASATHAATDFISKNRPPHMPLLRPLGKGSASMLRVVRDYLSGR
ncbi:protein DpdD [Tautonia plasticadhaerens]|uniref:Uncharacterized protein n=1 Tax=Tautonia plasticadhaerens TaxID=2527974 RepID=A0A518H986_9BACT|nr:protein DpdD [Tautonia plasticadhaerens]QDV37410.1 hypothetical protein ElP_53490 [Tautonia plasticadhaerens]